MDMKTVAAAITMAIAAIAPALGAQPVPYLPIPKDGAVILNSGSTNTAGYRIVIVASGKAEYVEGSTGATGRVPDAVASKFFADLRRAMPLSRLRVLPCMKSASFGTMTFVWWRGHRSTDVSCPGDAAAASLYADATAIADALHLSGARTIHMLPNEPRKPLGTPSPAASPTSAGATARAL